MIGWAMRQLALWGAVAFVLYAVGVHLGQRGYFPSPAHRAAATVAPGDSARGPTGPATGPSNALVFRANGSGHVFLDAAVNGAPVRFLVDTGATLVALTMKDAAAAGIPPGNLVFSIRTSTANGVARAAPVRLREVRVGQFAVDNVEAVVHENLSISLLGQSFLTRLGGYEMRDGVLTLNWN